jgi:hypothetical protein
MLILPQSAGAAEYEVEYPRFIDGHHHHRGAPPGEKTPLTISRGSAVLTQMLLGARGNVEPAPPTGVLYRDVYPDVSLVYEQDTTRLKETLFLASSRAKSTFDFIVRARDRDVDLSAVRQADGSIAFINGAGVSSFVLAPPTMYDSKGATSRDVRYSLAKSTLQHMTGYRVTVSADKRWLAAPDRAYPVAIDPTTVVDPKCFIYTDECSVGTPGIYGPDIPTREGLSVPLLLQDLQDCILDQGGPPPTQPVVHCGFLDDTPDVPETTINLPGGPPCCPPVTPLVDSLRDQATTQVIFGACGGEATRPKRSPGPGRPGPYFVGARAEGVCLGNGIEERTLTGCIVLEKNGDVPLSCRGKTGPGPGRLAVTPAWCCEVGKYYYHTTAFATARTVNGHTISSNTVNLRSKRKIRC